MSDLFAADPAGYTALFPLVLAAALLLAALPSCSAFKDRSASAPSNATKILSPSGLFPAVVFTAEVAFPAGLAGVVAIANAPADAYGTFAIAFNNTQVLATGIDAKFMNVTQVYLSATELAFNELPKRMRGNPPAAFGAS